jgi:crossover junction endodeoxyribonuclease RuvC
MGISPQQFSQIQSRLAGARSRPKAEPVIPECVAPRSAGEVVLGIDPSLRGTGWGILKATRPAPVVLGFGTLKCPPSLPRSLCLVRIAEGLRDAIRAHQPTVCAIEGLFYAQNIKTALVMGEARGVCLLTAAEAGLQISEIAPRRVKQAIVGFGAAQKIAVARMVQRMLGLADIPDPDAADALALALAHARDLGRPRLGPRPLL